jgi:phage pi2 protein 07
MDNKFLLSKTFVSDVKPSLIFAENSTKSNSIVFHHENKAVLRIEKEGKIFWKEREIVDDEEFIAGVKAIHTYLKEKLNIT